MTRDDLVVFAHVVGGPDANNVPGLLTSKRAVLVRGPAAALTEGSDLEVVIVPMPLSPQRRVERIRVIDINRFVVSDGVTSAVLLELAVASEHPISDLGEIPVGFEDQLKSAGNDFWGLLLARGVVQPGPLPAPSAELLAELPRIEQAQPRPAAPVLPRVMLVAGGWGLCEIFPRSCR